MAKPSVPAFARAACWRALSALLLLCTSAAHAGSLTVRIDQPVANQAVDASLTIKVTVTAQLPIERVVARVAGREVLLSGDVLGNYQGSLDVAELASGAYTLEVVATDSAGSTASATASFRRDRAPSVALVTPLDGTNLTGMLSVQVRCVDDAAACASVSFLLESAQGQGLLTANTPLQRSATDSTLYEGSLCVSQLEGKAVYLHAEGLDADGHKALATHSLTIESSSRLQLLGSVGGPILDYDARRILYREAGGRVLLQDRASGVSSVLSALPGTEVRLAALTPRGAVFSQDGRAFEWVDGELRSFGDERLLAVNGDWVLLGRGTEGELWRRRSSTGEQTQVVDSGALAPFAVGPDGDAVFVQADKVVWLDDGTRREFDTAGAMRVAEYAATDGINLTYVFEGYLVRGRDSLEAALQTPQGGTPLPAEPVLLVNGWAAFSLDVDGARQVYLRPPTGGTPVKQSPFGNSSRVDALGPDGEVLYERDGRRHLALPEQRSRELSSSLGAPRMVDGVWHVALGRSLYRLHTEEAAPPQAAPQCGSATEPEPEPEPEDGGCSQAGGRAWPWLALLCALVFARRARLALR